MEESAMISRTYYNNTSSWHRYCFGRCDGGGLTRDTTYGRLEIPTKVNSTPRIAIPEVRRDELPCAMLWYLSFFMVVLTFLVL
jgi:hypothetical protein